MAERPRFSVVMIFLDAAAFLDEAIRSVVAQTEPRWELLLVDDGSTDGGAAIARRYAEADPGRLRLLAHPGGINRGMSASRNLALSEARGELVMFLDADDVWQPDALATAAGIMEAHPTAGAAYGPTLWWRSWTGGGGPGSSGNPGNSADTNDAVDERTGRPESLWTPPTVPAWPLKWPRPSESSEPLETPEPTDTPSLLEVFLADGPAVPCLCSLVVRRELLRGVGGFEPAFRGMYEDQVLYAKLALAAPIYVTSRAWARYRQHDRSCCHRTARAGGFHAARRKFLEWLEGYLAARGHGEARVWRVLQQELWPYRHPTATAEVLGVAQADLDYARLWGGHLEAPRATPGVPRDGRAVDVIGWVLGRGKRARTVELVKGGDVVRTLPVRVGRPDIAAAFGDRAPEALRSGFHAPVNLLGVPGGALQVRAVFDDGSREALGVIRTRRRELRPLRHGAARGAAAPRRLRAGRALILLYHRLGEPATDPWALAVSPAHFAEHLEVLRRYAHPVPLAALDAGAWPRLPRRAVVITFDDGYADNLRLAKPVLERADAPATVFVTAGGVGTDREFWWDELDRLALGKYALPPSVHPVEPAKPPGLPSSPAWPLKWPRQPESPESLQNWRAWEPAAGPRGAAYLAGYERLRTLGPAQRDAELNLWRTRIGAPAAARPSHRPLTAAELVALAAGGLVEIGGHTLTHPRLAALSPAAQREEIAGGKTALEALLGREIDSFAYPHGGREDYTPETVAAVRGAGFARGCAAFPGRVAAATDRFELPRVEVQDWDGDAFAARLAGWWRG